MQTRDAAPRRTLVTTLSSCAARSNNGLLGGSSSMRSELMSRRYTSCAAAAAVGRRGELSGGKGGKPRRRGARAACAPHAPSASRLTRTAPPARKCGASRQARSPQAAGFPAQCQGFERPARPGRRLARPGARAAAAPAPCPCGVAGAAARARHAARGRRQTPPPCCAARAQPPARRRGGARVNARSAHAWRRASRAARSGGAAARAFSTLSCWSLEMLSLERLTPKAFSAAATDEAACRGGAIARAATAEERGPNLELYRLAGKIWRTGKLRRAPQGVHPGDGRRQRQPSPVRPRALGRRRRVVGVWPG